jgi:hypothetical protein
VLAAPAASAAELRDPTVSSPATVAPGQAYTVSGTGCFASPHGLPPAVELDSLDVDNGTGTMVRGDGTWSIDMEAPTQLGTYHWSLDCDDYTGHAHYPTVTLTVTADGRPVATPVAAPVAPTPPKPTPAAGCAVCTALDSGRPVAPGARMTLRYVVAPFQQITVVLHSTPRVLGTFTADAHGVVTIPLTVPADVLGSHHLLLVDQHGATVASLPLTVARRTGSAGSAGSLAYTGADVALPVTLGTVLVAAGAGAVVLGRRRPGKARQG